ncbi:hypothetical protein DCCM_3133 [Desulfocucumis palustris]|uniref:Uncharacterized protein n=1 Tax=Desulfocucumis palustris TaxID=1898651 RepID=A0A2L2XD18_9FIRM|nr:hypothetical protein DCCM_3133 [Desulfocucumis palustris]
MLIINIKLYRKKLKGSKGFVLAPFLLFRRAAPPLAAGRAKYRFYRSNPWSFLNCCYFFSFYIEYVPEGFYALKREYMVEKGVHVL